MKRACDANGLDTYCKTCSSCVDGEYQVSACTDTADTVCAKSTTCAFGKYQAAAAAGSADTVCTDCTTCADGKYQSAGCQLTSDTSCADCSGRANGQFTRQPCGGFTDATFGSCTSSCPNTHYIKAACTADADLVCEACAVCNDNEYQVSACTTNANAVCYACTVCPLNSRQTTACSDTADTVCAFQSATELTSSVVTISAVDLNAIKALTTLATEQTNTRLTLDAAAAKDFETNSIDTITALNSDVAVNYVADTTDPELTSFELNLNVAAPYMMLYFSETVLLSDFTPTEITLQSAATRVGNTEFVTLGGGSKSQGSQTNPTILKLVLLSTDVDKISAKRALALDKPSTCLVATKEMVKDAAKIQRELKALTDQGALPATSFTADDIDPELKEWTLNMHTGKLVISFDEVMDAASITTTEFTVQDGETATGLTRKLSTDETFSTDAASFEISLNDNDLNMIKKITTLAAKTDKGDSYLILSTAAAKDTTDNTVAEIANSAGVQVKTYTADTEPPTLTDFKLDLTLGTI